VLKQFDGAVEQASEQELAEAAAEGDLTGLYNCPHTGVALAALVKLVRAGVIQKQHKTVVISTANGLKFTDFKVRYHERALGEYGITSREMNRPVELPADFDADRRAVYS